MNTTWVNFVSSDGTLLKRLELLRTPDADWLVIIQGKRYRVGQPMITDTVPTELWFELGSALEGLDLEGLAVMKAAGIS